MDSKIEKLIEDFVKITSLKEYQFREVCGLTFVFEKKIAFINDEISSGEMKPLAIIYEENGEYYLAPLHAVDEINEVVKEFVRTQIQ